MANKLQLDLSGGMNLEKAPLVLNDNESELIVNYELTKAGALKKRPGYTTKGSQIVDDDNSILNIDYANPRSREAPILGVNAAGDATQTLYYWNGAAWTSAKTGDTASAIPHFENFIDYTFRANGNDDLQSTLNLTTWGYDNCPIDANNFTPYYVKAFEKRLYAARQDGTGEGARLYWSSLWDGSGTITWDETNDFEDIGDAQSERDPITGLDVNGNRLLIGTRNGLWRWRFGVENRQISNVGPLSQELFVTNYELGLTFFMTRLGMYIYAPLSEGRPRRISRPVQKWMDTITEQTWVGFSRMAVTREHVYLFLEGTRTFDDHTLVNPCFVYNIANDAWTVGSYPNVTVKAVGKDLDDGDGTLLIGNDDGEVFEIRLPESSTTQVWSDNGSAIPTDFVSKEYLTSFPEQDKYTHIDVFSEENGRTQVYFDVDRKDEFSSLGEIEGRFTKFTTAQPRGNSVRIRATGNSTGESTFEGFNIRTEQLKFDNREKRHGK